MPASLIKTSGPGFGPFVTASAMYVATELVMQIGFLIFVREFYKVSISQGTVNVRPIMITIILSVPAVWLVYQRARAPAILLLVFSIFLFVVSAGLSATGLVFLYSWLRCCHSHLAAPIVVAILTWTLGAILGGATVRTCWRIVSSTSKSTAQATDR
jgi:hypothetical protein